MIKQLDPEWIVGLCDASSKFSIIIVKNERMKIGEQVRLKFSILQPKANLEILLSLQAHFRCGKVYKHSNKVSYEYSVLDQKSIHDRIIPFFMRYKLKSRKANDFEKTGNGCFLKEKGKKTFLRIFEERLKDTIQHPTLKKKVSYKHLIRLECYKLTRYMLKIDKTYQPYKMKG